MRIGLEATAVEPDLPDPHVRSQVFEALGLLSPEHRAVVVLRYYLEYTPSEIATVLDLNRGTVNSRMRRALDQLGAVLDELPEGGALIRISEYDRHGKNEIAAEYAAGPHQPRPKRFQLGRPTPTECGSSYELRFQQSDRRFSVLIWTKPITGNSARGSWTKPSRISPATRREALALLDGVKIQPAGAEPIRFPMLALNCRNSRGTLGCDRIWEQVGTRVAAGRLSLRIRRWSMKTPEGWVFSDRISSKPTELRPNGGIGFEAGSPVDIKPRTVWKGVVSPAGLRGGGAAFERVLPAPGERWIGAAPDSAPMCKSLRRKDALALEGAGNCAISI